MSGQVKPLTAGLYFVATPIGTARDITLRALDILASADVIAAEDTRTMRKLMEIHGISLNGRPLVAYHDHNGAAVRPRLLRMLEEGKSVVYASEAGTPMVADPGFSLAREVIAAELPLISAPGPSAVITALTLADLPTDRFLFAGFPPPTRTARQKFYREFVSIPATLVFYESPKRINASLTDLGETLGTSRRAAICRELTKKFEEIMRGTIAELKDQIAERKLKGEIVLVVDRNREVTSDVDMEEALKEALKTMSVKDAASVVAEALNVPRRSVYQAALALGKNK
ncbi:MAG: 16S rRNA (cytidine(1402)-2'-O)-methyltransferase [Paracoccaceae bacterium]